MQRPRSPSRLALLGWLALVAGAAAACGHGPTFDLTRVGGPVVMNQSPFLAPTPAHSCTIKGEYGGAREDTQIKDVHVVEDSAEMGAHRAVAAPGHAIVGLELVVFDYWGAFVGANQGVRAYGRVVETTVGGAAAPGCTPAGRAP